MPKFLIILFYRLFEPNMHLQSSWKSALVQNLKDRWSKNWHPRMNYECFIEILTERLWCVCCQCDWSGTVVDQWIVCESSTGGGCSCMCCRYSLSLGVLLYHVSHHIRKNSFYQYFNCMVHFYKLVVNENVYKFDRFLTRLLHLEVNLFFTSK